MSEKCKAKYKNLNLIQSFSEQRYATVQLIEQACQNDEWLRQQVEKLSYLTPPAVRKRFSPILVDENSSYGYLKNENKDIIFDTSTSKPVVVDFTDFNLIDENKSDCAFESYVSQIDGEIHSRAIVPMVESFTNTDVKNFDQGDKINSFWYVGFDKAKNYNIRPDWIKDEFDREIPSVVRLQTFKVPSEVVGEGETAYLESVSLYLENNGVTNSNWASPLYVQIWNTKTVESNVTYWDKTTKKSVKTGATENIPWPTGTPKNPLAQAVFHPEKTSPGFYNFVLDRAVKVTGGSYYTIAVLSPLSHYEHCPRIGGWGRNCATHKYEDGDAFLSENNGYSRTRYGRNDEKVAYKQGKYTPRDFAFQCHIRKYETGYDTEGDYYLYLKPILSNPMTSVKLGGIYYGDEINNHDVSVTVQISTDGRTWTDLPNASTLTFNDEIKPRVLFVRAKLSTSNPEDTPSIEKIDLTINTELPTEMYVRTHYYSPKLSPMLGANLWGRIYAPFSLSPDDGKIDCSVEIIQEKLVTEHFTITSVDELENFNHLGIFDPDHVIGASTDDIVEYLTDYPEVIALLKKNNVYIKPVTIDNTTYFLSFDSEDVENDIGGLKLANKPAYPIKECLIQPNGTENVQSYGEWYDFNVNYTDDVFTVRKSVLNDMPNGSLAISYNPVFVDNLSLEEVADRIDNDTGLAEEGLILDYFKEDFDIDSVNVERRRVGLRVAPVDPIRQVILNKDTDDEEELFEGIDFDVDYVSRELVFPIVGDDGKSSILQEGNTLEVVYTPNLEDTSIAIGYYATREDTVHQCSIESNYFEYKV